MALRHLELRFLKGYSCSFSSQIKPHYCNNIRHFTRLTVSKPLIQYLKLGDLFASDILKLNIDAIIDSYGLLRSWHFKGEKNGAFGS